jgi:hypothetical protein
VPHVSSCTISCIVILLHIAIYSITLLQHMCTTCMRSELTWHHCYHNCCICHKTLHINSHYEHSDDGTAGSGNSNSTSSSGKPLKRVRSGLSPSFKGLAELRHRIVNRLTAPIANRPGTPRDPRNRSEVKLQQFELYRLKLAII